MTQLVLGLGQFEQLTVVRNGLRRAFPDCGGPRVLAPMAQLVKSLISSRTRDTVSWPVFLRLVERHPTWQAMRTASVETIEADIADVTNAKDKAAFLLRTLAMIEARHPDFDIGFLETVPLERALAWLQHLPGVGPKVAASVMNFSTFNRPSFVIDSHVLRLLRRLGLVGAATDTARAYRFVMGLVPEWSARELAELHVLLKRLGQTCCTQPEARCETCPVSRHCYKCLG